MSSTSTPAFPPLDIPEVSNLEAAFGLDEGKYDALIAEYNRRDALGTQRRSYVKDAQSVAARLFYSGGRLVVRDGVDPERATACRRLLKAALISFHPDHYDKMAVCGMIIEEFCDIEAMKD